MDYDIKDMNLNNKVDTLSTKEYVSSLDLTQVGRYLVREDGTVEFIKQFNSSPWILRGYAYQKGLSNDLHTNGNSTNSDSLCN